MTDFLVLGAAAVVASAIALIAGGTVKGVVGIGLPLVSLPVMATFIPVPKAIALLLLPSLPPGRPRGGAAPAPPPRPPAPPPPSPARPPPGGGRAPPPPPGAGGGAGRRA